MGNVLAVAGLVAATAAWGQDDADQKKVAVAYLNALTGAGADSGRGLLLGGVTMDAQLFALDNWTFQSKDPVRHEEGDLAQAIALMKALDKAGHGALSKLMGEEKVGDDLTMTEVSLDDARKLLAPTEKRAAALKKAFPVLAYVLRVGKEVYWHPKNPMRAVLRQAGTRGRFTVEVHRWVVLSREGPAKTPRTWPLRVVRFKTDAVDTGWKVLPASDWSTE